MNQLNLLEKFLFTYTRKTIPDERPLYAYKCRNKDYNGMEMAVRKMLQKAVEGDTPLLFGPFFCLYAAESWRRKHEGGPWKWETVFADICHFVPNHRNIAKWVREGLAYWRRPILKSDMGHNEYLVTIACEGGLPLLLLRRDNARLYRYFKNLLEAYHIERQMPSCDVTAIARRLAPHLSQSLRHEIVYNLGGNLVQKVVKLQELVTDAVDPIIALNQKHENWRDDLPLPLEDSTVELLLKNLVNDARTLAISEHQRVRWRRLLIEKEGEWTIEQRLEMPNTFTGAFLQRWTNRQDLMARLRILLKTPQGIEPIALITKLRGDGEDASYRCEILKRKGVSLWGKQALADVRLLVSDGTTEFELAVKGGEEWGPLPWIFGNRDGRWEYMREGSTRCRDHTVQVLLPLNGKCEMMDGVCIPLGAASELQRDIGQLSGTVLWSHPELGTCRIQCKCQDATEDIFFLDGTRLSGALEQTQPFLGLPDLCAIDPNGTRRVVIDMPMKWRTCVGGDAKWHTGSRSCFGEVWICYADSNGDQLFRRKVKILPATTQIEIVQIGINENPGKLRLTGLEGAHVQCIEKSGCSFQQIPYSDGVEIDCFADAGLPMTDFLIRLFWTDGRSLEFKLPLPRAGGAFVYGDRVLSDGERVPIDRLAAVQAVAQAPALGQRFDLVVNISTETHLWHQMWLKEPFQMENDGRSIYYLHRIQERIASILALSGKLNSYAILEIFQQGDRCLARIEVGQFDMFLEPNWENNQVELAPVCQGSLEDGCEQRITMRMVRLWSPSTESVALRRNDAAVAWKIPENLESGPWWILGEDGDWPRFRPFLWVVPGEPELTESTLECAIRQTDPDTRQGLLRRWLDQVAKDPDHPDWPLFFDHLQLIRRYPASALDLFCQMVKFPEAMVLALLKSSDEDFDAVWSMTYQLPFSWYLIPIDTWMNAAERYFNALQRGLATIDTNGEMLWDHFKKYRERVTNRRPFFRQICDWLCTYIFPEKPLENSELLMASQYPEAIANLIIQEEQKFQARHDAEEQYPVSSEILEWTEQPDFPSAYGYRNLSTQFRSVRCAPFVAAHISLKSKTYNDSLLFELKSHRDFDREWFTASFAFALCLGLCEEL